MAENKQFAFDFKADADVGFGVNRQNEFKQIIEKFIDDIWQKAYDDYKIELKTKMNESREYMENIVRLKNMSYKTQSVTCFVNALNNISWRRWLKNCFNKHKITHVPIFVLNAMTHTEQEFKLKPIITNMQKDIQLQLTAYYLYMINTMIYPEMIRDIQQNKTLFQSTKNDMLNIINKHIEHVNMLLADKNKLDEEIIRKITTNDNVNTNETVGRFETYEKPVCELWGSVSAYLAAFFLSEI
jgi:hypothetical protein